MITGGAIFSVDGFMGGVFGVNCTSDAELERALLFIRKLIPELSGNCGRPMTPFDIVLYAVGGNLQGLDRELCEVSWPSMHVFTMDDFI